MRNLKKYIEINHHLMTIKEMMEETGAKYSKVYEICRDNGWTPIIPADRIREYIRDTKGIYIEDVMERFGTTIHYAYQIARSLGVALRKRPAESVQPIAAKPASKLSPDAQAWVKGLLSGDPDKPKKRIREAYNQSGSPYGIADDLYKN